MKKILLLLLITVSGYSQTLLKLKAIEYAPGSNYCIITNSLGVQTYTPCSSITNTVVPTLQQVITKSPIVDGTLAASTNSLTRITVNNDVVTVQSENASFTNTIEITPTYFGAATEDGSSQAYSNQNATEISYQVTGSINNSLLYITDSHIENTTPLLTYNSNEIATINQLPVLTASTNITISGTTPNYTISTPTQTTGLLTASNNLSELTNVPTARQNLHEYTLRSTTGDATTTSNVIAAVPGYSLTLTAGKTYKVMGYLHTECNNTGGIFFNCTIPSGTMYIGLQGWSSSVTAYLSQALITSGTAQTTAFTRQSNTLGGVLFSGTITVGVTGGTCSFGFGSGVNTQQSKVDQAGSFITLTQLD